MKCPKCHEEIQHIIVNSKCFQVADIAHDEQTGLWHIVDYGSASVEDTINMTCSECFEEIPSLPDFVDLIGISSEKLRKYKDSQKSMKDEPR